MSVLGGIVGGKKRKIKEINDGISKTYVFFEDAGRPYLYNSRFQLTGRMAEGSNDGRWAHWQNFFSIDALPFINQKSDNEIFSFHHGGAHVAMCDGSVHFINENIKDIVFVANYTYNAGDKGSID